MNEVPEHVFTTFTAQDGCMITELQSYDITKYIYSGTLMKYKI